MKETRKSPSRFMARFAGRLLSMLTAVLERMGVNIRANQMKTLNVAAISVTATMPAFARAGSQIKCARERAGRRDEPAGRPLAGDGAERHGRADLCGCEGAGRGFGFQEAGASISQSISTSARIASGAIIEREVQFAFKSPDNAKLALRNPDFTTTRHVANVINRTFPGSTEMLDPSTTRLAEPDVTALIERIAQVENLPAEVDQPAKVIVNEAAGTVVTTTDMCVSPVAIARGG